MNEHGLYEPRIERGNGPPKEQTFDMKALPDVVETVYLFAENTDANTVFQEHNLVLDEVPHTQPSSSSLMTNVDVLKLPAAVPFPISSNLLISIKERSKMSKQLLQTVDNGGQAYFSLLKLSKDKNFFYALKFVESTKKQAGDIKAYWLPASQSAISSIEIPVIPGKDDPKYLFTAGFSGCSLTVDYIAHTGKFHIRHVFANKENEQYNNEGVPHSHGMVASMENTDYTYTKTPKGFTFTTDGFAWLQFESKLNHWVLRYRSHVFEPKVFDVKGDVAEGTLPSERRISNENAIVLDENSKLKEPVASLPISSSITIDDKIIKDEIAKKQ